MYTTDQYEGAIAETITYQGHNGDAIHAYVARPLGPGPFPGMVLVTHAPGWDEYMKETARRLAAHGYITVNPDIYCRVAHGAPDDVAAKARSQGGVPDDQTVADNAAAARLIRTMPISNGKVGIMGFCSGGRSAFLTASRTKGVFDAAVNCWGGRVVVAKEQLTPNMPVAPIDYTKDLSCRLLGIFGNDDQNPTKDMVNQLEAELKKHNKDYEFHRYDNAGHGFFYWNRPAYRVEQAMDGWNKVWTFLAKELDGKV